MDLFETVVAESDVSPLFRVVRDQPSQSPARRLMNRVFDEWPHRRREFRRDFQTDGFSARTWELALFAYMVERDYSVDSSHGRPDFLVSKGGVTVALEATTTNPPRNVLPRPKPAVLSEGLPQVPKDIEASRTELVFQLAKALRKKLNHVDSQGRHYSEVPLTAGLPFLIAVEAFHGDTALSTATRLWRATSTDSNGRAARTRLAKPKSPSSWSRSIVAEPNPYPLPSSLR